jgi:long-chain acyl-CoA synthetase
MLPNCVEMVLALFAAWRMGAAVTPVNPVLTAQFSRKWPRPQGSGVGQTGTG